VTYSRTTLTNIVGAPTTGRFQYALRTTRADDSGLVQKGFELHFDAAFLIDGAAVFQILNLLLELRPAASFRFQPRIGDIGDRHTGDVQRIEEPAVPMAVGGNVAAAQNFQRTFRSASAFSIAASAFRRNLDRLMQIGSAGRRRIQKRN